MRAENVWRLPQSLRDGWRRGFERASESHRDGWLLITSDVQRPFTFFPFFLPCLSILSGTFVHFLFPSLPSRRLVHDAHRGEVRHPHFLACFLFPLFLSLTSQRIPVQFWSCRKDEQHLRDRTWHATQGYEQNLTKSMLAGPAARELGVFLPLSVEHIPTGDFHSVKGLYS